MEFYRKGRQAGDFESGIQEALARVLVAPRFVYRAEEEPATTAAGQVYRVSDVDLASRLSFFLWSSIPDDELLDVAAKGRLRDPKVLDQQVKRMLADAEGGRAGRELRRSVALSARARHTSRLKPRTSTRTCASPSVARPSCCSNDRARRSQSHRSARRRLHVRGRAARPSLRHSQYSGQLLPPRAARRRTARAAVSSDTAAC